MPKYLSIIIVIASTFSLATVVFANPSLLGTTPESENPTAQTTTPTQTTRTASCYDEIITAISQKEANFYLAVDTTLQSANLNSDSLNYLFKEYRKVYQDLDTILSRGVRRGLQTAEENAACNVYLAERLNILRTVFVETYQTYLGQKRGFILNEKYDSINSELEKIDEDLRATKDNFAKFNDLLPCYATQCINR